jgi:acetolactate synthase-1/2/3 large subunit
LVKPYVKWSNTVTSKKALADSINRGCQIAQTAPCGPVFLAVPRELMAQELADAQLPSSVNVSIKTQPVCDDLTQIAGQLVKSKQPVILTEYAGENQGAVTKLVELAELLSIPVFESVKPIFANFPKTHPLFQGIDAAEILAQADTILVVGATTPWFPPSAYPKNNARVIVLDEDPLRSRIPYHGYRSDFSITGDIEQSLSQLINAVHDCMGDTANLTSIYQKRLARYSARHNQMAEESAAEAEAEKSVKPISPKWFHYLANRILPANAISIVETLTHSRHFYRYLTESKKFFRCSGGGLGSGMGIAIGAKIASPDTPVIFYVGDGSFNYNPVLAGLGLCQEYRLPIMTVILNNKSYAAMRHSHRSLFPAGWAVTHDSYLGVDISPQPDYVKIAEAFDAYAAKIEDPDSIEPVLKGAVQQLADGKSVLLNVIAS